MLIRNQLIERIRPPGKMGDDVECLRHAERTLGRLVRRGQQEPDKWISSKADSTKTPNGLRKTSEFFTSAQERHSAFKFAEASDEEFGAAIAKCNANNSIARARVLAALTDRPPEWVRNADRPPQQRGTRRVDLNRAVWSSLDQMFSIFEGLDVIFSDSEMYESIPAEKAREWELELNDITGKVRTFRTKIKRGQSG